MRELHVCINSDRVGVLSEEDDIWAFTYATDWLEYAGSYPLSQHIPLAPNKQMDGSTRRHIQWFFDNLLPEEGARELLARDVKVAMADAFGLLEACGAESAGAITLLRPGESIPKGEFIPLSTQELSERIARLPDVPLNTESRKRMSLAGAQHKMLIIWHQGQFIEPSGQMPSSHILKPEHLRPNQYWQTVRNEWFVMNLASKMGLDVPDATVCYVPEAVYVIERFDRLGSFPGQSRLHVLDGCQLLGLSRSDKYTQSNAAQLNEFASSCRSKGVTKLSVFRWALFNALLGNGDAHLKNLSCILTPGGYELAPVYDLLCTAIYSAPGQHLLSDLAQPMGNADKLGELSYADILKFGSGIGIPARLCDKEIRKMLVAVMPEANQLYESVAANKDIQNKAGELRMLRQITELVIKEMVKLVQDSMPISNTRFNR